MYKAVKIVKGKGGWGGPLIIKPEGERNKIVSVTGGGIHPLAQRIADLTGAPTVDGFSTGVADSEIACVVVDCGGTARCGVYPKKGVFTVNITPVGQSGPLAKFIKEEIYVSGVTDSEVTLCDGETPAPAPKAASATETPKAAAPAGPQQKGMVAIISKLGKAVGGVINKFFSAGRDSIDVIIKNVIPFMAFVAMLIGIIQGSGLGDIIANTIAPYSGSLPGLLLISLICSIPFLSPILGPGAVIGQVVGTLVGTQIATGAIPVALALPALYGINAQVGCDFHPVGLSLAEAEPETIEIGVPAILFSRLITGPASVLIGYAFSIGMVFK